MTIEEIIRDYLTDELPDVPIFLFLPEKPPATYVTVERTSGGRVDFIKNSVLALQSVSTSLKKAAELNERVKAAMDSAISLDVIARSRLNTDYNFTDNTKKHYRYQAIYQLTHY